MASDVTALEELCLKRVAGMLKSQYWHLEIPVEDNPFRGLTSGMIERLIDDVTDGMHHVWSSELRPLIRSDRVVNFKLEGYDSGSRILMDMRTLAESWKSQVKVLEDLASSCSSLRSITIELKMDERICATRALNPLLRNARAIRNVDSDVCFDISCLRDSDKLQRLVLNFHLPDGRRICDFLTVNGQLKYHASLTEFMVAATERYSALDVATVLQYCPQLTSTNCDLSGGLEYLHAEELRNGSLTQTYKIEKCLLGRYDEFQIFAPASSDSVRIASLTCPSLRELELNVCDNAAIDALGDCRNICSLAVYWIWGTGDYTTGLRGLLARQEIGPKLRVLEVGGFCNIDFSSIGTSCTNLERLRVRDSGLVNPSGDILPNVFEKLRFLTLSMLFEFDVGVRLICNAPNLERIEFFQDEYTDTPFTDDVFRDIFDKNKLSKLKHINFDVLMLTLDGWRTVARSLTALESVSASLDGGNIEAIEAVFRGINPRVSVKLFHLT